MVTRAASSKKAATKSAPAEGETTETQIANPESDDPRTGLDQNVPAKKEIHMNAVGPKRRLAFALVAVMALVAKKVEAGDIITEEELATDPNFVEAKTALRETGYESLKPRAEREAELKAEIGKAAVEGRSADLIKLAKALKAVQEGRPEPGTTSGSGDDESDAGGGEAPEGESGV